MPHIGYVLVFIASLANTINGATVKLVPEADVLLFMVFRNLVVFPLSALRICWCRHRPIPKDKKHLRPLILTAFSLNFFNTALFFGFR